MRLITKKTIDKNAILFKFLCIKYIKFLDDNFYQLSFNFKIKDLQVNYAFFKATTKPKIKNLYLLNFLFLPVIIYLFLYKLTLILLTYLFYFHIKNLIENTPKSKDEKISGVISLLLLFFGIAFFIQYITNI